MDRFVRTLRKSVVVELEDKVETDEQADGDYIVDEKHKTCTLTAKGIKKAEEDVYKRQDLNALEAALKLKDETGCEVVVVTMGPPPAEGMLRELLARGADKAVLVLSLIHI